MSSERVQDTAIPLSPSEADALLAAWLGRRVACSRVLRLTGGMIFSVFELAFDGGKVVVKVGPEDARKGFEFEARQLHFLREKTGSSLYPEPFHVDGHSLAGKSVLLMERKPGAHLEAARLDPAAQRAFENQLAEHLASQLHTNGRDTYGDVIGETWTSWGAYVQQLMAEFRELIDAKADPQFLDLVDTILPEVPRILDPSGPPTLIHGDLWAGNILAEPDGILTAILDPASRYADVEDELAYLECFGTVSRHFFDVYTQRHPLRTGYERRRPVYWLNTTLIHIHAFGDAQYHRRGLRIAQQLRAQLTHEI